MAVKIFRMIWFLSLLAVTGILLYQYANLSQSVVVMEDGGEMISISRDSFFYIVIAFICVLNVLVFIVGKLNAADENFRSWFYGLIISLNFFFIIAISFITLYNGGEKYDYQRLQYIIYAALGLFMGWAILWPLYWGFKRLAGKS